MNSVIYFFVIVFFSFSVHAGTGIKNGGSGFACAPKTAQIAEIMLAKRFSKVLEIDDRILFFNRILRKIENPVIRETLEKQWQAFGDSEYWPVGNPDDVTVYSHGEALRMTAFGIGGVIQALNPSDPVCVFPAYAPSECCDRILFSYFGRSEPQPLKVLGHYGRLTRFQKNVLELHEAIYKMSQTLGAIPSPAQDAATQKGIMEHRSSLDYIGEIPSSEVHALVTLLLQEYDNVYPMDIQYYFLRYWQWSNAIYP